MEALGNGNPGQHVINHVVAACGTEKETATILSLWVMEKIVPLSATIHNQLLAK